MINIPALLNRVNSCITERLPAFAASPYATDIGGSRSAPEELKTFAPSGEDLHTLCKVAGETLEKLDPRAGSPKITPVIEDEAQHEPLKQIIKGLEPIEQRFLRLCDKISAIRKHFNRMLPEGERFKVGQPQIVH